MVWLNSFGLFKKIDHVRRKVPNKLKGKFVDTLRMTVKGGHGGNGMPKYGGVGGQGGCVYFTAQEDVTLEKLGKQYPTQYIKAGHGEDSSKVRLLGRRGVDRRISVPVGVSVIDENGKAIAELNEIDQHCIVAGGGGGGCSGNSFLGHAGQSRTVTLDLKLIADVGLVGFPNAGKSTLLKAISNASPKIASYPFTTIRPQIGVIGYEDYRQISVADLPGLIEGAHANIGMGHKFLKHIERTRLLVMVVDIFGFKLSPAHPQRSCMDNIFALNKELELYDPTLFEKPCILLLNKIDTDENNVAIPTLMDKLNSLNECSEELCPPDLQSKQMINFERIIPISAKDQTNIQSVKLAIRDVLDEYAERKLVEEKTKLNSSEVVALRELERTVKLV